MECVVLNNFELCFVCNEYMNKCRNHLSVTTGYSEKSLHSLIGKFVCDFLKGFRQILSYLMQNRSSTSLCQTMSCPTVPCAKAA